MSSENPAAEGAAARQSRRLLLALLALALFLIGFHVVADRLIPSTGQARVTAYVVPLAPQVAGTVTKVLVSNNQRVSRGQPLYTLSDESYLTALEKARADLAATERELVAQDASIVAARAQVRSAEASRESSALDLARLKRIYAEDKGAISLRRLETAQAASVSAEARRDAAIAQLDQAIAARGLRTPANDRLVAARAAVDRAEIDVARTTVRAPADGLVTDLSIDVGQFAGAGAAVMSFVSLTDVWISADYTENNLGRMQPGDRAEILLDVAPGRLFPGVVRSIGFGVAPGPQPLGPNPGALPSVSNSRDFLRPAQRFPVVIAFLPGEVPVEMLRQGGQADVLVYTGDNPLMDAIGRALMWVRSWLSFLW